MQKEQHFISSWWPLISLLFPLIFHDVHWSSIGFPWFFHWFPIMILLSSLHTRASEVRCGGHLTVARQGFLRSRMEEVEAFLDMDRHASWTGNHRFYHRFFWWFFILCFVKISGRVALFLFWAAQEHGGIYIIIYICVYIYVYIYVYIQLIDCWFIAVYYYGLGGWNERLGRYIRFVPNRSHGEACRAMNRVSSKTWEI